MPGDGDLFQQQQKDELIAKLLACPCFKVPGLRAQVELELPEAIRHQIVRPDLRTDRSETLAIVNACLVVEQGLAWLIRVIGRFDGGTLPFEAVQVYVDALGYGGMLPFNSNLLPARNPKFVGREKELASLHKTLQDTSMVAVTALHGLGGVGKTSLAIEYIYRHQKAYNLIAWLPAENRLTLELEFIGLLGVLGLPSMPIDTEENRAAAVGAVKRELGRRGKGWLLVFDNAEKPEDVAAFRPGGAAGHVIVTSRNVQMGKLGRAVEVDVLTEGDALALLGAYCCIDKPPVGLAGGSGEQLWRNTEEAVTAKQLVAELGYLALAIIQAGAYIQATGSSVAGYLTEFRQTALELFGSSFTKPTDYSHTVGTTWELSFKRVSDLNPGAADFLNLLAFFAPNGIRLAWFSPAVLAKNAAAKADLPESLVELTATTIAFNAGLATLLQYSLLQIETAGDVFSLHRLVQKAIQDRLSKMEIVVATEAPSRFQMFLQALKLKKPQEQTLSVAAYWFIQAGAFLLSSFPNEFVYTNLGECDAMISHLQALIDYYIQIYDNLAKIEYKNNWNIISTRDYLNSVGAVKLFTRAANYYYQRSFYTRAHPLYERAITITEKMLGSDHLLLAPILNNLAEVLRSKGEYKTARPLFERAIMITEKTLGSNHSALVNPLTNLALLLQTIGEDEAARPLHERAIVIAEKTLGNDHPGLANCLNNLAIQLIANREYAAARPLLERAISIDEKILGSDHPHLALCLSNLANILSDTGDYAAARPLLERAVSITEKALGSDHPDLAKALNNLALLLSTMGEYATARPLLERAVSIGDKTLGSKHPDTLVRLNNLASLLQATGDYTGARLLHEHLLAIIEKVSGSDHVDRAIQLDKLASLLKDTGDYTAAKLLYEQSLAIAEKRLGNNHSSVAGSLNNLANLLQATGDYVAAKPLYERAISIGEKTLDTDHPGFAVLLWNYADFFHTTGESAKACAMLEKVLATFETKLGATHPHTITVTQTLLQWETELAQG